MAPFEISDTGKIFPYHSYIRHHSNPYRNSMDIQALLNALPQPCLLISPESQKIAYINNLATRLIGKAKEDLMDSLLADHLTAPLPKGAVNLWRKGALWLKIEEQKITLLEKDFILFTLTKVEPHINPVWIQNAVELSEVMVHRFRSTLTGIMGFADMLAMEDLNESASSDLEAMQTGLKGMREMLNELDKFRQVPKANVQSHSLFALLEATVNSYRSLGEKRIQLEDQIGANIEVMTDGDLFVEMISNLINNAIDAVKDETDEIRVTIKNPYEITIYNSGSTIKPEHIDKIFHPFFTTKAQSLGLGLSRSALIAESMGMYLYLKINNKQEGVVFSIELEK